MPTACASICAPNLVIWFSSASKPCAPARLFCPFTALATALGMVCVAVVVMYWLKFAGVRKKTTIAARTTAVTSTSKLVAFVSIFLPRRMT